jgi:hypothetical protein
LDCIPLDDFGDGGFQRGGRRGGRRGRR